MQTGKKFKMVAILVGLMLALIVYLSARPVSALKIAVVFVGFTNDVTGSRVAKFKVSNDSGVKVVRWGAYRIDMEKDGRVICPTTFNANSFLLPEQSEVVELYPPETKGRWRVSIYCAEYGSRVKWGFFARRVPRRISEYIPERFLYYVPVPDDLFASDWVGQSQ